MKIELKEITVRELADGYEDNAVWHVKGYEITCRSFPWNGWQPLLVATPSEIGAGRLGYSNCEETVPASWYYKASGTATVFYPDKDAQEEILQAVIN